MFRGTRHGCESLLGMRAKLLLKRDLLCSQLCELAQISLMLVASASFPVGLLRPAVPRRRATRITACEPSLGRAGRHLEACGDALVAAAAVLGENQFQEEEPGSWSAAGCALAISGRDFAEATAALADSNWEAATGPLASAAAQFCIAAASTASHADASAAFEEAAAAVEDASSCTGCISLAAAAGPSLAEGGAALQFELEANNFEDEKGNIKSGAYRDEGWVDEDYVDPMESLKNMFKNPFGK